MLAEFLLEIAGEILQSLIDSKKVPKAIRILILSAVFIPIIALILLIVVNAYSTAEKIIIGALAAFITAGYIVLLHKIAKS